MHMRKWFTEIFIILAIIVIILALVFIPRIFGAQPGPFSKDLVAIAIGIPVMLALVAVLGLLSRLWSYTIGKIIIIAVIALIVILCIVL